MNGIYNNSMIYKEKTKAFHDKVILWKEFHVRLKTLLFHSCFKIFPGKLCSCWNGPFVVTNIFNHSVVKTQSLENKQSYQSEWTAIKTFL